MFTSRIPKGRTLQVSSSVATYECGCREAFAFRHVVETYRCAVHEAEFAAYEQKRLLNPHERLYDRLIAIGGGALLLLPPAFIVYVVWSIVK